MFMNKYHNVLDLFHVFVVVSSMIDIMSDIILYLTYPSCIDVDIFGIWRGVGCN